MNAKRVRSGRVSWKHGASPADSFREQTSEAAAGFTSVDSEKRQGRTGPETGADLEEDQNPEGAKLKSVAGAKQIRQERGVVPRDRLAESVETLRVGSGGSWQPRREGLRVLQALKSAKVQEGCPRGGVLERGARASVRVTSSRGSNHGRWRAGTLEGRGSLREKPS
jgi:hypothetical protein